MLKFVCKSVIMILLFAGCTAVQKKKVNDIYASKESWLKSLGNNMQLLKNRAFKYVKTEPGLPRVLLYGDSISIGYTPYVRNYLKGKATVQRIPCNGGDTASGFAKLKQVGMEKGKWDVIHFNWGLHDLKYVDEKGRKVDVSKGRQAIPVENYKKNLVELIKLLKSSGARLIFATTTPVGPNNAGRIVGDARKYNMAAVGLMKKNGIMINDLYGLLYPELEKYQLPNNVHYNRNGYMLMAKQVAEYIEKILNE